MPLPGERTIDLVFDGCQIGAKGLEGPYVVQQLIVSGGGNSLGPLPVLTPVDLDLSQFSCRLETTPPETTYALSPPAAAQSWNRTSVVVTLTADDGPGGAGVREIHESFTGAQSSSAIDPGSHVGVAITAEGTTALSYFAVDNAGNAEGPHTLLIKIDKTAPVIKCPANVSLMYLVTPSMIGLAKATDGLDPAPVVTNDSPQLFGIGTTIVTWTATDVAGNTSTCQQAVTVLDLPQGAYDHLKRR